GDGPQVEVNKLSSTKTQLPYDYYILRYFLTCKVACHMKLDAEASKSFKEKIDDEYRANM
ncbi:hypothetical protein MKW92_042442, partial [Papaver armeniacum]